MTFSTLLVSMKKGAFGSTSKTGATWRRRWKGISARLTVKSRLFINPSKHPHVKAADGQKFLDWPIAIAAAAPGLAGCSGMEIVLLKGKSAPRPG